MTTPLHDIHAHLTAEEQAELFPLFPNGDMRIAYLRLDGKAETYSKLMEATSTRAKAYGKSEYFRARLAQPEGKKKYNAPTGSGIHLYLTALSKLFSAHALAKQETLYIVEGEKKAYIGSKFLRLPFVGIAGISMWGNVNRDAAGAALPALHPDFELVFAAMPNLKRIVLMFDADARDGDFKRKGNFFSAVKNFKEATKDLPYEVVFSHLTTQEKGLDDLLYTLLDTPAQVQKCIDALEYVELKNPFFAFIRLKEISNQLLSAYFFTTDKADAAKIEAVKTAYFGGQEQEASLVADYLCTEYCFVPENDEWLVYTGTNWRADASAKYQLASHISQALTELYKVHKANIFCIGEGGELEAKQAKEFEKRISRLNGDSYLKGVINLLKGKLSVSNSEFDTCDTTLNVLNGELDLRTRTLRPHNPFSRMRMLSNVAYDESEPYFGSDFLSVLSVLLSLGNDKLTDVSDIAEAQMRMRFMQEYGGLCLTGQTTQHILFNIGQGSNGKSTFFSYLKWLLGGYAKTVDVALFVKERGATANIEHLRILSEIAGKRFVACTETPEGAELKTAVVKGMTGDDEITARAMHSNYTTFTPNAKYSFTSNHYPIIKDTSDGTWRRLLLMEWKYKIADTEAKDMKELLVEWAKEGSAVLNWLIDGLHNYWKRGNKFLIPASVQEAVANYRDNSDGLSEFVRECLEKDEHPYNDRILASTVFDAYVRWCKSTGQTQVFGTTNRFYKALRARGMEVKTANGNKMYLFNHKLSNE